jgi:putative FmdB family regulatory protein
VAARRRPAGPTFQTGNPLVTRPFPILVRMPTYEYVCQSCGTHVEVYQRFSDDPLTECGVCGGPLRKVFHPAGILFKGSGFYATDSRSSRSKASSGDSKSERSSSKSEPSKSTSSSESSSTKSDTSKSTKERSA